MPTHYDSFRDSYSLIDFYLISNSSAVLQSNQFYFSALNSNHAFLLVEYDFEISVSTQYVKYRDYSAINIESLISDIYEIDFSILYCTNDTDIQLSHLSQILLALFEEHVPEKMKVISTKKNTLV